MKRTKRHNPIQKHKNNKITTSREAENKLSETHNEAIQDPLPGKLVGRATLMAKMYQGPFPPPENIDIYEQYCPGFLDRLVTMTEKAQESQIEHKNKLLEHEIADAKRGMFYGFIAFVGLLLAIIICALAGYSGVATALAGMGGVGLIPVIGQFIWGRTSKPKAAKAEPEPLPTAPQAAV